LFYDHFVIRFISLFVDWSYFPTIHFMQFFLCLLVRLINLVILVDLTLHI